MNATSWPNFFDERGELFMSNSITNAARVTVDQTVVAAYPEPGIDGVVGIPSLTQARLRRFMGRFVVADSGCWEWTGCVKPNGYGVFQSANAHRVAYAWFVAPFDLPHIDHLCSNRRCVNPKHLEPVTISENVRRAYDRRDVCSRGHAKTPDNTYLWKRGGSMTRVCRVCKRDASRRWEKRNGK